MANNASPPDTENATENTVTGAAPRRSLRQFIHDSAGWLVFAVLFMLAIIGLCVSLSSRPLQIHEPKSFEQTVPRKVVPVPVTENTWPTPPNMTVAPPQQTTMTVMPAVVPPKKPEPISVVTSYAAPSKIELTKHVADHHLAHFDQPVIAIVIDDMGLDRRHSTAAVNLPGPITLSYMPYAQQIEKQAEQAQANGHELIVHMPMEPDDLTHNNPGPDALLIKNGEAENVRRLDKNLTAFTGFIGINNHMGSAFTANRAAITPVLQDLKQRGLWFLDSKTDARSVAADIANDIGLPYATRDVFLDNINSRDAVLKQLHETEEVARRKGYAIAIGHPKEGTMTALQNWTHDVQARGFTLVPLSTIIAARFPDAVVPRYAKSISDTTIAHQDRF